jgi:hypothetical protein
LAAPCPRPDDEVTVYAVNRGMTVVTHDREFTARRKRHTIGLHVRLMCAQPDAVDVLRERHDELLDVLSWTDTAVVEVYRTSVRHHPPRWDLTPFSGDALGPILGPNWANYGDPQRTHTGVSWPVTDVSDVGGRAGPSMACMASGGLFTGFIPVGDRGGDCCT